MKNKVALVTGGGRGIGRAVAAELARKGMWVALGYNRSAQEAQEAVNGLTREGCRAMCVKIDVLSDASVNEAVKEVTKAYGAIDVLVNNAGIGSYKLFQDCDDDELNLILNINLLGAMRCARAVIGGMINRGGVIVNTSSIWGLTGASQEVVYSASKAGIIGFTRALAKELAPSNVRVNAVAPGVIDTDMTRVLGEETLHALIEDIPLGRLGTAEDVARAVAFLAGDESAYITGQVLTVAGGYCQ